MLKENLQLILKGLPNSHKIAEGIIKNTIMAYGTLKAEEQEEIMRRRAICEACPFMSLNALNDSTEYEKLYGKKFTTERKGLKFCCHCGCNTNMKTASLSSNCGIETWNNDNPTKQIELKWKEFNK